MLDNKIYKVYRFKLVDGEGDLLETYSGLFLPVRTKSDEVVLAFEKEEWSENPVRLIAGDKVFVTPREIDTYLMRDLDGRFLSWLSDRE